jgi:aminoglycoside phosphotransferase (APT) family kinase protein
VNGAPFYVMDHVDGLVLRDQETVLQLPLEARAHAGDSLVDVLARIHAVDPDAVGLGELGRKEGYIERQLKRWYGQWEKSKTRELPDVDHVHDALAANVPEQGPAAIVHGDYRLDNALVIGDGDDPHISAILDWEMATLGDPFVDLGIFALYWDIASLPGSLAGAVPSAVDSAAGYPSFDELIEVYADRAAIGVPDLRWYRAFAAYKLAVILEGIHYRYQAGETVGSGFGGIGALVEPLAAKGLEVR